MGILIIQPPSVLESYVRRYISTNISKENRARLFPHGNFRLPNPAIRMAFHFSDKIPWLTINGKVEGQPRQHIRGYQTSPIVFNTNENLNTFTVEFTPFGFYRIFGLPCSDLELIPLPIDEVIGQDYRVIIEELARRDSFNDRVNFMNSYFIGKISEDPQMKKAFEIHKFLIGSDSLPSVKTLANEVFITERTMRRFFNEYFGMPPKQYLKLLRFEKTINALLRNREKNIFEVVIGFGYHDHPHFLNDFKFFMNMTPRDFQTNILKKRVVVN